MGLHLSFEFFPPRTAQGFENASNARRQLNQFKPDFFSCTYGAGGSTRLPTLKSIEAMLAEGLSTAPHLACVGLPQEEVKSLADYYLSLGIERLICLRGDTPSGVGFTDDFAHANQLVSYLKNQYGNQFQLYVAAYPEVHPQAYNAEEDLKHFITKCKAGADAAITQYFYNSDAYFHFVDEVAARGVDIPIIPGIMPIASFTKLARFSDRCSAEIPRWLRLRLQSYADDTASIRALGLDFVTELCKRLLEGGAPGLHFYTLNRAALASTIVERLGF